MQPRSETEELQRQADEAARQRMEYDRACQQAMCSTTNWEMVNNAAIPLTNTATVPETSSEEDMEEDEIDQFISTADHFVHPYVP